MVKAALAVSLVYFILYYLDYNVLSWQAITRPIVVAPLVGLALGDFKTGIIMGASLESIFMGISAIGGAVPADATSASAIAVAYTILTGASAEEGLAIAMPIGTVMASFNSIVMSLVNGPLAAYWEDLAQKNIKRFNWQTFLWSAITDFITSAVLFFAVAYGVEGLNSFLNSLPSWVMTGLTAASSMMVGVGFAILTSMIWDNRVGVFFFVGYVIAAYTSLGTLPIAFIAFAAAITIFFIDKDILDAKNEAIAAAGTNANAGNDSDDEEDFF
jgi:PTS system mannose-specific IIC component/fructoselysine and glucoselysine-specific PTS system IIC component